MVNNFEFYAPTRVVFGRKTEEQTGALVRQFGGSRVLIVYGGKSAVRSGLLDTVRASLAREGLAVCELGGVVPNPHLGKVYEGIRLGRAERVDFLLAVGGGSVIDTAKAIAYGLAEPEHDVWELGAPLPRRLRRPHRLRQKADARRHDRHLHRRQCNTSVGVDAHIDPAVGNHKVAKTIGGNVKRSVGADASVRPMGNGKFSAAYRKNGHASYGSMWASTPTNGLRICIGAFIFAGAPRRADRVVRPYGCIRFRIALFP